MNNILVLSSSPRRGGNSDLLCDQFIAGAQEKGHKTEKIFLKDKTINYCLGCGTCVEKNQGCVQNDDMRQILEKMLWADVIAMATPVYFYTLCGQMKTLIDRTIPIYKTLKNKEFYFIVAAADNNIPAMERTIESFRGFTACLKNPVEKGIIYGVGVWGKGEIKDTPLLLKQAFDMGKSA